MNYGYARVSTNKQGKGNYSSSAEERNENHYGDVPNFR